MRAIVGLGNPGSEYDGTRHNVGFAVIDRMCETYRVKLRPGKGDYSICSVSGNDLILVKPMTFMNNSGSAVSDIFSRYELSLQDVLVVVDDIHLPLGTLRLRISGTDGGHNGLRSIIYQLGSDQFPRLRCGIGSELKPNDAGRLSNFVLSQFDATEIANVTTMCNNAADVATAFAHDGIEAARRCLSNQKI